MHGDLSRRNPGQKRIVASSNELDEFDTVYTEEGLLRYKSCKLTLFPWADGAEVGCWVLKISLLNTEGGMLCRKEVGWSTQSHDSNIPLRKEC